MLVGSTAKFMVLLGSGAREPRSGAADDQTIARSLDQDVGSRVWSARYRSTCSGVRPDRRVISSTMLWAIWRSPMITKSAPRRLRCSTSASECARDDLQARIRRAPLLHHLAGLERFRNGHDEIRGLCQIGPLQDVRIGGIPEDRLDPGLAQRPNRRLGLLHHHEWPALRFQELPDRSSDPTVTDEDGVAAQRSPGQRRIRRAFGNRRFRWRRGLLHGRRERTSALEMLRQQGDAEEYERIETDRQKGASKDQITTWSGSTPSLTPSSARTNENSPI
jgi:hypothetical protein